VENCKCYCDGDKDRLKILTGWRQAWWVDRKAKVLKCFAWFFSHDRKHPFEFDFERCCVDKFWNQKLFCWIIEEKLGFEVLFSDLIVAVGLKTPQKESEITFQVVFQRVDLKVDTDYFLLLHVTWTWHSFSQLYMTTSYSLKMDRFDHCHC
jgi:hypothetical protein